MISSVTTNIISGFEGNCQVPERIGELPKGEANERQSDGQSSLKKV